MSNVGVPKVVSRRLGYALKRAQHALRISMDEALRPIGLTAPQFAVLAAIEGAPGLSNAQLARAAFVTPQAMQGVLANLEREGVLTRALGADNARVLHNTLTPRGAEMLARAHDVVSDVEDRLVEPLTGWDLERLADSLTRCAENLRPAEFAS